jgi:hypothetical protein
MEQNIVGGLFGLTPEMYQQNLAQQELQQGINLSSLSAGQAGNAMLYAGGAQLGRGIGGALGGQDPQLQLISARNAVLREVDPTDPESLMNGARRLAQFDPQGATSLATMAREAQVKLSQVVRNTREGRAAGIGPEGMRAQREAQLQQTLRQLQSEGVEQTPEVKNSIQLYKDELSALQRGGQGGLPAIAKLQSYKDTLVEQLGADHPKVKEVEQAIKAETQGKGTTVNVGLSTVDKEANLRKDFTNETKPLTTALSAADKIEKLLRTNTSLGDIIAKKQFNKVAGDNNISNKDVAELANYGDLGQRLAGTLSQFFEGKYTQGQREEALSLVNQLKSDASNQYSTIQKQYRTRVDAEKLPPKTAEFVAPDLAIKTQTALPSEGTKLRNKKTGKIEIVRGGKLVPAE